MKKIALVLPFIICAAPAMACDLNPVDEFAKAQAEVARESEAMQRHDDAAKLRACMACTAYYPGGDCRQKCM
jgi:hypothetical protein